MRQKLIDNQVRDISMDDNLNNRYQVTLPYKTFNHTADLGVEICGPDCNQLFINAGRTLFDLICGTSAIDEKVALPVTAEGGGYEDLMVSWLRELLYLHQVKGDLLSAFIIHQLDENRLIATVKGEQFDARRHGPLREIKAVTYHQLTIEQSEEGWTARIVFDI
jgi:SHS2 domain-containing protein